ncbi:MAG: hypothetical protein JWP88_126 [Flaviaesturariibacter sp.]|nr:hypothetical protein [Flaviaesturariibacter sp.]
MFIQLFKYANVSVACLLYLFSFSCCNATETPLNTGSIIFKYRIFDSKAQSFKVPDYNGDSRYLYKDSFFIGNIQLTTIKDLNGKEVSRNTTISRYVFADLRKRHFYNYKTFSDTASLLKSFMPDHSGKVDDGWKFFISNSQINKNDMTPLPDTIMYGAVYKRLKGYSNDINNEGVANRSERVAYYRCDIKGAPLSLDNDFSRQNGCPVLRLEYIQKDIHYYVDVEYRPGKFTPEEEKVFSAWENYAKEHPVSN